MTDIPRIPSQVESGDPSAAEQLLPRVYEELRKLATAKLAREKPGQTLQATALVHEAYLRLVDVDVRLIGNALSSQQGSSYCRPNGEQTTVRRCAMKKAMSISTIYTGCLAIFLATALTLPAAPPLVVLEDDFSELPSRLISSPVGAHTEYHYLKDAAPVGNWSVSTFSGEGESQRAWRVQSDGTEKVIAQTFSKRGEPYWHPMLVAGDSLWQDYTATVRFAPQIENGRCGIAFRYQNDRCYYFLGLQGKKLRLLKIQHASAFHRPDETVLAEAPWPWKPTEYLTAIVTVHGSQIRAGIENGPTLEATDNTFQRGRIALLADGPSYSQPARRFARSGGRQHQLLAKSGYPELLRCRSPTLSRL